MKLVLLCWLPFFVTAQDKTSGDGDDDPEKPGVTNDAADAPAAAETRAADETASSDTPAAETAVADDPAENGDAGVTPANETVGAGTRAQTATPAAAETDGETAVAAAQTAEAGVPETAAEPAASASSAETPADVATIGEGTSSRIPEDSVATEGPAAADTAATQNGSQPANSGNDSFDLSVHAELVESKRRWEEWQKVVKAEMRLEQMRQRLFVRLVLTNAAKHVTEMKEGVETDITKLQAQFEQAQTTVGVAQNQLAQLAATAAAAKAATDSGVPVGDTNN